MTCSFCMDPKLNNQEVNNMQENNNNPYVPGPVKEWKMTPEELAAYVEKHPIIYREELKPSPAFTMSGWENPY